MDLKDIDATYQRLLEQVQSNARIAEHLGWRFFPAQCDDSGVWPAYWQAPAEYMGRFQRSRLPDFYENEEANALLLEEMRQPVLEKVLSNDPEMPEGDYNWFCSHDCDATGVPSKAKDRRTAIVLAFLKKIEAGRIQNDPAR